MKAKRLRVLTPQRTMYLCILLVLSGAFLSYAQEAPATSGWKLIKHNTKDEGWKLYKRKIPNSKIFEFKITGIVKASIQASQKAALDLVINPKHYKSKKGKEYGTFEILDSSKSEYVLYSLMYGPFLFKDRDVVLKYHLYGSEYEAGLKWRDTTWTGYEEKEKIVRMPVDQGDWHFKNIDGKSCYATNVLRFHPGGKMPSWMVNMMIKMRLPEELENLRKVAQEF